MDFTSKLTIGQTLSKLRGIFRPDTRELCLALKTSHATYRKIERDQRDLSFLMALRLCQFYDLDIHEFISMLADHELDRPDLTTIKDMVRRENKKKCLQEDASQ